MSVESNINTSITAGFWRRLVAFLVDCILLAIIGFTIGFVLTDVLVQLDVWGRWLGFAVALAYFGTLNSKLTGGQTPGKKLLGIKVMGADGAALSVAKASLRYVPLAIPWFLNGAPFSEHLFFSFWLYLINIGIFGLGLAIVYLYIFNRKTRQSIHDLLVGSYVVSVASTNPPTRGIWQAHIVVGSLLIVLAGVAPYFVMNLTKSEAMKSMLKVHRAVSGAPWVKHAQIKIAWPAATNSKRTNDLNIIAYSADPKVSNPNRAQEIAKLALAADPSLRDLSAIRVTLVYGYDIGIASSWRSYNYAKPPAMWLIE